MNLGEWLTSVRPRCEFFFNVASLIAKQGRKPGLKAYPTWVRSTAASSEMQIISAPWSNTSNMGITLIQLFDQICLKDDPRSLLKCSSRAPYLVIRILRGSSPLTSSWSESDVAPAAHTFGNPHSAHPSPASLCAYCLRNPAVPPGD